MADAVLDTCFPPDRTGLVAVLQAYFDESGTDLPSPWITLAGFVSEQTRWKQLSIGWRRVLARYGVLEAKGADMEARQGCFRDWTDKRVEDFRWALSSRIDDHARFGVSISCQRADYERVVVPHLPEYKDHQFGAFRDPYVWLMAAAISWVMKSEHLKANERVHFIFDDGHEGQGKAEDFFYWMHDAETDRAVAGRVVRQFTKASSFDFPPLQAADLLAWGSNRGLRDRADRPFVEIPSIIGGVRTPIHGGSYDARGLEETLFNTGSGGPDWRFRGRRRGIESEFTP